MKTSSSVALVGLLLLSGLPLVPPAAATVCAGGLVGNLGCALLEFASCAGKEVDHLSHYPGGTSTACVYN